ncbi:MAG: hypothetical protein IH975_04795 [Nitrospinae bacterium]|nr:hypothetical protein [Nitrospinota bacterium]
MIYGRLIKTIEDHAEELTQGLVKEIKGNKRSSAYEKIDDKELERGAYASIETWGRGSGRRPKRTSKGTSLNLASSAFRRKSP